MNTSPAPPPSGPKPGYRTTEFWLSTVATLLGLTMAGGFFTADSTVAQYLGGIIAVLSQLGYTGARVSLKKQAALAEHTPTRPAYDDRPVEPVA